MKRFFLLLLVLFMAISVFAETKISVTQSIRYGNGNFAEMDSPQISLDKAMKEGGKVFFRYDFEILSRGILDSDSVYIFLKFPSEYDFFNYLPYLKVLTLSGVTDVIQDLLVQWKGDEDYDALKKSTARFGFGQYIWHSVYCDKHSVYYDEKKKTFDYEYEGIEDFVGIVLRFANEKQPFQTGNKAHIEFYLDFNEIRSTYEKIKHTNKEYADWIFDNCLSEIKININFHNHSKSNIYYGIPKKEFIDEAGYQEFSIYFSNANSWEKEVSISNRTFTIMVSN